VTPPNIAVVGAGIAGCSAAWFLRQRLGEEAAIAVYERDPLVGGRLATLDVGGTPVEAGGTIIHETNRNMAGFVDRLGLQRVEPHQRDGGGAESVGVWDGRRLVFRTHASTLRTRLSAAARYGVRAPLRMQRAVARGVEQWNAVYAYLEDGSGFVSPHALCSELGLAGMLEIDGRRWLSDSGVRGRFVDEYASPVGRVMYGQDVSMHALATSIALAGAGLAGSLFSVGGGNRLVCEGLLREADAKLHTGSEVVGVSRAEPGFALKLSEGAAPRHDVVVLATPAGAATLELGGLEVSASALRPRPFQTTWATFVMGEPRADYFGLSDPAQVPDTLLTLEDDAIPFSSLGLVGASPDGRPVYKFFSREEPKPSLLDQVFPRRDAVEQVRWQAYPVLGPSHDLPPFRLTDGLYWVNAMEFAVSTMETETVAARNVANLVVQERRQAEAGG
jgi:prenylcysteine oxidase/farnesylcysteine lyase